MQKVSSISETAVSVSLPQPPKQLASDAAAAAACRLLLTRSSAVTVKMFAPRDLQYQFFMHGMIEKIFGRRTKLMFDPGLSPPLTQCHPWHSSLRYDPDSANQPNFNGRFGGDSNYVS
jgi:hypothetical protein